MGFADLQRRVDERVYRCGARGAETRNATDNVESVFAVDAPIVIMMCWKRVHGSM